MTARSRRTTYRHGNLKAEALEVAYRQIGEAGHDRISLRQIAEAVGVTHRSLYNHFADREALLDAVATEGFMRLTVILKRAKTSDQYTARYVRFALAHGPIYVLMASRPHATMKNNPPLQAAVHGVITEAMRVFCNAGQTSPERRRTVMKAYMILHGGISTYAAGILDLPNEKALIDELAAMTASV